MVQDESGQIIEIVREHAVVEVRLNGIHAVSLSPNAVLELVAEAAQALRAGDFAPQQQRPTLEAVTDVVTVTATCANGHRTPAQGIRRGSEIVFGSGVEFCGTCEAPVVEVTP